MEAVIDEYNDGKKFVTIELGECSGEYAEQCRKSLQSFLDLWGDLELEDG